MNTYKDKLMIKASKKLNSYDLTQYEYLMVTEYIESNYKSNRGGFISYLDDLFFKKIEITLNEYQNLFDLA